VLSGTGLIAKDWSREVGVNYAPPSFVGADAETPGNAAAPTASSASSAESEAPTELPVEDPLAEALAAIRGETRGETQKSETGVPSADSASVDPLADVMADIRAKGSKAEAVEARAATLPFGAIAGYYGRWLDDIFNWFYSVFTAIPYLLLILAVAAVLQQKGMFTIILILGLTGWTGCFRLIRGEYLKHKGREYVQAADAIG